MSVAKNGLGARVVIVVAFLLAAGAAGYMGMPRASDQGDGAVADSTGPHGGGEVIIVDLVYSVDKHPWIDEVLVPFHLEHPNIRVNVRGQESMTAARDIVRGRLRPTVWSPSDDTALALVASGWRDKHGEDPFVADTGQPLVRSPLVFVTWPEVGEALTDGGTQPAGWRRVYTALTSPEGWQAIGGNRSWGKVRIGYTDPAQSDAGLAALLSMAYEYAGKTDALQRADIGGDDDASAGAGGSAATSMADFITTIEGGVTRYAKRQTDLIKSMVSRGPKNLGLAVLYEQAALTALADVKGQWAHLQLYYPEPTVWAEHNAAIFATDWVSAEQRQAAVSLLAYLRSPAAQERAIHRGFRAIQAGAAFAHAEATAASTPEVAQANPNRENDGETPFVRAAERGLRAELPPALELPSAAVIDALMTLRSSKK